MNLQKQILAKYAEKYPNETLREIANKTNINITRIFRIIHGKPMKLSEFEIFQNLTNQIDLSQKTELIELAIELNNTLNNEKLNTLNGQLKHLLKIESFKNKNFLNVLESQTV